MLENGYAFAFVHQQLNSNPHACAVFLEQHGRSESLRIRKSPGDVISTVQAATFDLLFL
jgi:hypothetical protein